jgi:hypothetical protein
MVGTTTETTAEIVEAVVPQTSSPKPVEMPAVVYWRLLHLPLSGFFISNPLKQKARRLLSGQNTSVPGDTDYSSQTWKRLDPSSGKRLGSHTSRIT